MSQALQEYVRRRSEVLRTLDVLGYVQLMLDYKGEFVRPDVALLTMHKARYELFSMPPALRQESREWLEQRGYNRMFGLAWPPASAGEATDQRSAS